MLLKKIRAGASALTYMKGAALGAQAGTCWKSQESDGGGCLAADGSRRVWALRCFVVC